MKKDKYIMSSLSNALDILDILAEVEELGVAEISRLTNNSKSSVFKMLYTLESKEFVSKTQDAKYRLGFKFIDYGNLALQRQDIVTLAKPYIQKLRDKHNETTHLGILDEDMNVHFLVKEGSKASIVMASRIGKKMPFYATSVGKAIVAFNSDEERTNKIKNYNYVKLTENTITNYNDLLKNFEKIQERGYSEDLEEYEVGLSCFAVPIFGAGNKVVAAVSASGPTERMMNNKGELVLSLKETSLELSRLLGYNPGKG